jgi:hypothetical protein
MVLLAACSFDHGIVPADATRPDVPPDVIVPTWQIDSASHKAVPAATFEWNMLLAEYGLNRPAPDHLWLMQETSGPLADSIGAAPLNPFNAPSYSNQLQGWSRHAVGTNDLNATDTGFGTNVTGNLDGTAYLLLVYLAVISTPSGDRSVMGIGANSDHRYVAITASPVFKGTGTGVMPTIGTINPMADVHPVIMKITPSQMSYVVYTDQEKLTVAWAPTASKGPVVLIGNAIIGAAAARYLYGVLWVGAGAEATDADVKKLLQALGWTVTGY